MQDVTEEPGAELAWDYAYMWRCRGWIVGGGMTQVHRPDPGRYGRRASTLPDDGVLSDPRTRLCLQHSAVMRHRDRRVPLLHIQVDVRISRVTTVMHQDRRGTSQHIVRVELGDAETVIFYHAARHPDCLKISPRPPNRRRTGTDQNLCTFKCENENRRSVQRSCNLMVTTSAISDLSSPMPISTLSALIGSCK